MINIVSSGVIAVKAIERRRKQKTRQARNDYKRISLDNYSLTTSVEQEVYTQMTRSVENCFFNTKREFNRALELYNRTHCCKVDNTWVTMEMFMNAKVL